LRGVLCAIEDSADGFVFSERERGSTMRHGSLGYPGRGSQGGSVRESMEAWVMRIVGGRTGERSEGGGERREERGERRPI
jgi:hypothetical protein